MGYLVLLLAIALVIAVVILSNKDGKIKSLKSELERYKEGSKKWLEKNNALIQSNNEKVKEIDALTLELKKLFNQKGNSGYKPKQVIMYREANTTEKQRGIDYKYLGSYASYRQAQAMTGIARKKISDSVKFKKWVKNSKLGDVMVIFASADNNLKSDEKQLKKV